MEDRGEKKANKMYFIDLRASGAHRTHFLWIPLRNNVEQTYNFLSKERSL